MHGNKTSNFGRNIVIPPMRHSFVGVLALLSSVFISPSFGTSTQPPGAPGFPHFWAPALKEAVGTFFEKNTNQSPIWFTVAQGIMTEAFYPTIDQPQLGDLQFLVTDGQGFFSEQKQDTLYKVSYATSGMSVTIEGTQKNNLYRFRQTIVTDAVRPVIRTKLEFEWSPQLEGKAKVFLLVKPALQNGGSEQLGYADPMGLFAYTERGFVGPRKTFDRASMALLPQNPFKNSSVGYVGVSDPWQEISKNFQIKRSWGHAGPGNISIAGELALQNTVPGIWSEEFALGFGKNIQSAYSFSKASLQTPFEKHLSKYNEAWRGYLGQLIRNTGINQWGTQWNPLQQEQLPLRSAAIIKIHEDKSTRGAIIASLSKPGIPEGDLAAEGNTGGYHLVWPRDLYHAAMGLLAAGDSETAVSVLEYFVISQKPDGTWDQNTWIDQTAYWKAVQMDQISFPIILAWQLQKRIGLQLDSSVIQMINKAAQYLVKNGPMSPQDRWEEASGYIPSTMAAEIAALNLAYKMTQNQIYLTTAKTWNEVLNLTTWVTNGPWGQNYFVRVSPTGNPNTLEPITIANGGGNAFSNEILDGGFLELVRLNVREASDPMIVSTLQKYQRLDLGIAEAFPGLNAFGYRRYNRDAYGFKRIGGYWPLLSGEKGHYDLAAGNPNQAKRQLLVLSKSALESGHIPEQKISIDPKVPVGLGGACPLVWAHAELILLSRSIEDGMVFDSP